MYCRSGVSDCKVSRGPVQPLLRVRAIRGAQQCPCVGRELFLCRHPHAKLPHALFLCGPTRSVSAVSSMSTPFLVLMTWQCWCLAYLYTRISKWCLQLLFFRALCRWGCTVGHERGAGGLTGDQWARVHSHQLVWPAQEGVPTRRTLKLLSVGLKWRHQTFSLWSKNEIMHVVASFENFK